MFYAYALVFGVLKTNPRQHIIAYKMLKVAFALMQKRFYMPLSCSINMLRPLTQLD